MPKGNGGARGNYTRVDWSDDSLRVRVDTLAGKAQVRPGVVLEWLAATHLAELEKTPGKLTEQARRSRIAELEKLLAAEKAALGE